MKKLNVVYSGEGFFPEDLEFLRNGEDVEIVPIPALGNLVHPASFADKLKSCDLAIFKVNGGFEFIRYMQTFGEIPLIRSVFHSSKIKKVLWSVDTHVMQGLEATLSELDYFDRIYSAHSAFMKNFSPEKSSWLPCCYRLSSIRDLKNFNEIEYPTERDVLFYYNPTPTGDRNEVALRAKSVCDKMGLKSLFGHVGSWGLFAQFIKTSKVNLNISMNQDLNYRFFELQAFNAFQLADRVDDHSRVAADWDGVRFIRRDMADLESILQTVLSEKISFHGLRHVVQHHTLLHRLAEICNQMLGTSLKVEI